MKNALQFLVTAVTLVSVLVACGKKNDDGAVSAQTPNTACNIPGNTSCTPSQYSQFGNQLAPYTWQTYQFQNNGAFCGCPVNYRPVMNPQLGLSCAPEAYFQNGNSYGGGYPSQYQGQYPNQYQGQYPNQYQWQYQGQYQGQFQGQFQGQYGNSYSYQAYSYQDFYQYQYAQNGQISSIPQVSYAPAVSGQNRNCFTQAASVCDTQGANSCAAGATCRPSAGGSRLGFCTGGYSDAYYGAPQVPQQQNCYSRQWGGFSAYACGAASYYGGGGYYGGGYYNTGGGFGGQLPR